MHTRLHLTLTLFALASLVSCSGDIEGVLLDVVDTEIPTQDTSSDSAVVDLPTDVCVPDCTGKECGDDGCGGDCGQCPAVVPICEEGLCQPECLPECNDKECGDDGCNGSCGSCPEVAPICDEGVCKADCIADCDGKSCGDNGCGGSCGICPDAAPLCDEGKCVLECIPDCTDKECGSDGCLDNCGLCDEELYCNDGACEQECTSDEGCTEAGLIQCSDSGIGTLECMEVETDCYQWSDIVPCPDGFECLEAICMEVCIPDCLDKDCGPDGCAGSCGDCDDGFFCNEGLCDEECVSDEDCGKADTYKCSDDEMGVLTCEEVEDGCLKWSEPEACDAGWACADGECYEVCLPVCDGKVCGDDGCEGSCGECDINEQCTPDGLCVCQETSILCGELCCDAGQTCLEEVCCTPMCDNKVCGDDGCGGSCGECGTNETCSDDGQCKCVEESTLCVEICCDNGQVCFEDACCAAMCEDKECGDNGCGGTCGECGLNEGCTSQGQCMCVMGSTPCGDACCENGLVCFEEECCASICDGKVCGDDGCGGSCGECGANAECNAEGQCLCVADSELCDDVCCDNGQVCFDGSCCAPMCDGKDCGTDGCGGFCGQCGLNQGCTSQGICLCVAESEPCNDVCCNLGDICFDGSCCALDCDGKECGTDGCGGACGQCGYLLACNETGQCVCEFETCNDDCCKEEQICLDDGCCTPDCEGKNCGSDGCGGSCGECGDLQLCSDEGLCECEFDDCGETCCEDVEICHEGACCKANCNGKVCGDDGCGGSCGSCGDNETCNGNSCVCAWDTCLDICCSHEEICENDVCISICTPACEGKECGTDGCGGECGTCKDTETCNDQGLCLDLCELNCVGKVCGTDGCGGSCGLCADGQTCTDAGQCVDQCTPNCLNKECGLNGCGGSCGNCNNNQFCNDAGQCVNECTPDCFLKECGDDGCGGSCGDCDDDVLCTVSGACGGQCLECLYEDECSTIDFAGGTLSNWNIDAAVVLTHLGETPAPTSSHMLKLTTGEGLTVEASYVHFQTCLQPGNYGVAVDWKFYSEEFKEWCGSNYQDSLQIWLEVGGETVDITELAIKDLCGPEDCNDCGSHYLGLEESDVEFDHGGVFNTPWTTSTIGIVVPEDAPVVTLHLELSDAGDSIYDTVVLIDRVQFLPCADFCNAYECGANPPCDCAACPDGGYCKLDSTCCVPDCDGKDCGPNGCGGTCGECAGLCTDGICCIPDCNGKECGDDGCGNSCGTCWGLEDTCVGGTCVCVPDCDGKDCGADGCGSTCGDCNDGLDCSIDACDADGICSNDTTTCCMEATDCNDNVDCTVDTCDNGTCTFTPDPGCCETKPFSEYFEDQQANGWVLDATVDGVGWNIATIPGNLPPTYALYYGNPITHNYNNGNINSGVAQTPAIALLDSQTYTFSFSVFMDVENLQSFDTLDVDVSVSEGDWITLWEKADYDSMETWQEVALDVTSLAGSDISFRFVFDTADNHSNNTLGALIDNVTLTTNCSPPTCVVDIDCEDDVPGSIATCDNGICVFIQSQPCNFSWDCNDNDVCTSNQCSGGFCVFTPINNCCHNDGDCGDDNLCTTDSCDDSGWTPVCAYLPIENCCLSGDDCDDNNMCTNDICPGIGEMCSFMVIDSCCLSDADCSDNNDCTLDLCFDMGCLNIANCCELDKECNDGNVCTTDTCNNDKCVFTPVAGDGCCVPPLFSDDFSTDKGWTYGQTWERGGAHASPPVSTYNPDPAFDHSTSADNTLAGVLIGGNTTKTVHGYYYLTSPVIDLTDSEAPHLAFWKMLNSDYPNYMTNIIQAYDGAEWSTLWVQQGSGSIVDKEWTLLDYDISAYISAQFQFRIGYKTGSSGVFYCPSWSIDDVTIYDEEAIKDDPLCCGMASDCNFIDETAMCQMGSCSSL
jgi:hypothetical protein